MAELLLHNAVVSLDTLKPDLTVLDFLREVCHKRGSKEGCASGDCGACTVVVTEIDSTEHQNTSLRYQSINACITFVGALQGKQLITVEDLEHQGVLHPVQQAMIDQHGSQCGFCTPGFIMSMFALFKNIEAQVEAAPASGNWVPVIERYLGGNLCRCTGYRPIVDACLQFIEQLKTIELNRTFTDQFTQRQQQTIDALVNMQKPEDQTQGSALFHIPKTMSQLEAALAEDPSAVILAGGTDLALEVTQKLKPLKKIVCLTQIEQLQKIEIDENQCSIGAGVSLSQCMGTLGELFPQVQLLLHRFGSTQIRNQATVGGNIANASPVGDLAPVLLALDASVVLRARGEEREIALSEFFTAYKQTALHVGEYIHSVLIRHLPAYRGPVPEATLKIYKISKRFDDDISAVCAVFNIFVEGGDISSARIALGGMAEVSARAPALERALVGASVKTDWTQEFEQQIQSAISADFTPISDARASASYRSKVTANLVKRLFLELNHTPLTQVSFYA